MALKTISRDQVCDIIDLARPASEADLDKPAVSASSVSTESMMEQMEHVRKVSEAIEQLGPEGMKELTAIMWLGRGDYEASDFETAKQYSNHPAGYLAGKTDLSKFLTDGLAKLDA